jgi:DNA-binding PadR family transcriptional regulator
MALRHAVLASLLDGEASGYDLARRMDISVGNFWHVLPTQLYAELRRLEDEGLIVGREVVQARRPNKRLFSITEGGREELERFTRKQPRPTSIKDELLVQIQAADVGDMEAIADAIEERRKMAEVRLAVLEGLARTSTCAAEATSSARTSTGTSGRPTPSAPGQSAQASGRRRGPRTRGHERAPHGRVGDEPASPALRPRPCGSRRVVAA